LKLMNEKVESLKQFYRLMYETRELRRNIVKRILNPHGIDRGAVAALERARRILEEIPQHEGKRILLYGNESSLSLNLSYEIDELVKDIFYLTHPEKEFFQYLEGIHEGFREQITECQEMIPEAKIRNFIADRDGTLNNYCGRYRSSIQSVYNSVFLSRFAQSCTENAVILTSAPLRVGGLLDVSIDPEGIFSYAGSKGREYQDRRGRSGSLPLEKEEQKKLRELNTRLSDLVKDPDYEIFSLIGSGLQFKFGQTTIARQDIYGSIQEEKSEAFARHIHRIIAEIDPEGRYFRTEDTGKDIEILLTVRQGHSLDALKDFDKGNGIEFLDRELGLQLERGPNLICGDTRSDVSMVSSAVRKSEDTRALFVSRDESVRDEVRRVCRKYCFLYEPDTLVCLLNTLWERTNR
jgi:hypothetical protein